MSPISTSDAEAVSPRAAGAAWDDAMLRNPHGAADKQERIGRMFAAIAGRYDLNNRLHSLWRDQAWRRFAVKQAGLKGGEHVLDVACGTGDLTERFARGGAGGGAGGAARLGTGAAPARVVGLDYTRRMLTVARSKRRRLPREISARIEYMQGDAQRLPFADASFDVVSIAFGIRNVQEPARAAAEFRRVLRPGGRLVILEFAEPTLAPVRWFNDVYCRRIMPVTATLISGDRSGAYRYLPRSVSTFMSPAAMRAMLESSGFAGIDARALSLGICVCYRAGARGV